MRAVILVVLLVGSFGFMHCTRAAPRGEEAKRLVQEGATLVDVRTPEEFAAGHLPGAVNIPIQQLANRLDELGPKDSQLVVYCRSGARSTRAEQILRKAGYDKVLNLGPMSAW